MLSSDLPSVPIIETERLILRGHRPDDFEACLAMRSDPGNFAFISGGPSSPSETHFKMLCSIGHWAAYGWGYWAVELKSAGFIGEIGFGQFRRDINPSIDAMPEMGWVLIREHHGRGYAAEACQAALDWMDKAMLGVRTCCIINPANTPSIRLAERIGYSFWAHGAFKGETTSIYRR